MFRNIVITASLLLAISLMACRADVSLIKRIDNITDNISDNTTVKPPRPIKPGPGDDTTVEPVPDPKPVDPAPAPSEPDLEKDPGPEPDTDPVDKIDKTNLEYLRPHDNETYGNPYNIVISGDTFTVNGKTFTDKSLSVKDSCSIPYANLTTDKFVDGDTTYLTNRRHLIEFNSLFSYFIGSNTEKKVAVIVKDIDMCNHDSFTTIGFGARHFKAFFNGNNKIISNLLITDKGASPECAGFICSPIQAWYGGQLRNIGIEGKITLTKQVSEVGGAVAQLWAGDVTDVRTDIEIIAPNSNKVGGIVGGIHPNNDAGGSPKQAIIKNVKSFGNITAKHNVGGIIGDTEQHRSEVENLSNYGEIKGNSNVGGVVGFASNSSPMKNISNRGAVTGISSVGGVVGLSQGYPTLINVLNRGDVTGNDNIGGVIGNHSASATLDNLSNYGKVTANSTATNIGGVIGYANSNSIMRKLSNRGTVTGRESVGGIIGFNAGGSPQLDNLSNYGVVTGITSAGQLSINVGGVIGYTRNSPKIDNLSNYGAVTGNVSVGGVIGMAQNSPTMSNIGNRGSVAGNNDIGGVIGLSQNTPIMRKLFNRGRVVGNKGVGGVIGSTANAPVMENLSNYDNVTGNGTASENIGGIIGNHAATTMPNICVNDGVPVYYFGGNRKYERCTDY